MDLKDVSLQEYCDKMIMSGSNIEEAFKVMPGIEGIVLGRVLSIKKHPDADKLFVCQVHVGMDKPVQIVTGATNVT